jgi:hypothetical protein
MKYRSHEVQIHDPGGRHVAEDKDDMWPNQMVTSVKVDVAHKDYESHESG